MMVNVLKELKDLYPNTCFRIKEEDGFLIILFDNLELEGKDNFLETAYNIACENLTESELGQFSIVYDYLNEICMTSIQENCFEYKKSTYVYLKEEKQEKEKQIKYNFLEKIIKPIRSVFHSKVREFDHIYNEKCDLDWIVTNNVQINPAKSYKVSKNVRYSVLTTS